ncbi:MFS transporter [Nocardioides sp. GY 10127]|uniref:MFS transporter n=1 Tax=Nocardioides sp. GY 10127 TaxID=2569762 RepID=UPI0010A8EDDB|nr:MFS transporter [Nocardioides sp. GY 10127]TIC81589.1 MFS transporter [Nocardioides sp. GY 10127]
MSPHLTASLAPLRARNFRFYYASRVVNLIGNTMATVALAFAVLDVTDDDPAAVGYVLAAHTVPLVLLLLWGGVVADRFGRVAVLQVSNLGSALTQGAIAALVLTGTAQLWSLMALSLVHGIISGLGFPAMSSVMPTLVPREQLQQANALVSLARSAVTVLGPTVAALLVVGVGPGWALGVDAASWLVSALLLMLIRVPAQPPRTAGTSTIAELREGWGYVRSTTWLWVVVLGFGFLNALHAGAWLTLGPSRAKATIGEEGWGLALSAEAVGLLVMTLVLLRVRLERPLLMGMLGITTLALPMIVLGAEPHLGALVVATFIAGAGTELFGMGWNLAMQEHVPDDMLSRAYSYDALGSFVAMPIGQVAFGPLALAFGFGPVMVAAGLAYVLLCGLVLCSSSVRNLRRTPSPSTASAPASAPASASTSDSAPAS